MSARRFTARASTQRARPGRYPSARVAALVPIIREVLAQAIEAGGSTLKDFRQADGELGYFQHRFDVYGREGEPCRSPDVQRSHQTDRTVWAVVVLLWHLSKIA